MQNFLLIDYQKYKNYIIFFIMFLISLNINKLYIYIYIIYFILFNTIELNGS